MVFVGYYAEPVDLLSEMLSDPRNQSVSDLKAAAAASALASEIGQGDINFLDQMKRICEIAQPRVCVRAECFPVEGSKAATVLFLGEKLGIDIIIIGQRRTLSSAILGSRRPGGSLRGSKGVDTAEYLIENCKCTCVGVQKKGQNGGYILNTKTHKNFWLLA
ncbi:PREDICTED: uncharacterized protein LOC104809104 [Tarenaya hassleriana]|uniref:uncharacterized protein LOC104809104 n=1 Tax=Tarenaya hassleriana TaxID=28532 RepID=UPI00053CA56D|nr:PREDICTED: uncharacterized protein LOC104809104 [Tarenaya hassleriana]